MTNNGTYILITMADFQTLPMLEYGSHYIVSNEGQVLLRKDMFENFSKPFQLYDSWAPSWFFLPKWAEYVAIDANSDTPVMYNVEPVLVKDKFYLGTPRGIMSKCSVYKESCVKGDIKVTPISVPRLFKFSDV